MTFFFLILFFSFPEYSETYNQESINPPGLSAHSLAFDSKSNSVYLFGGSTNEDNTNDLWRWKNDEWTKISPSFKPAARNDALLIYHPINDKLYLLAGRDWSKEFSEFWEWDGKQWKLLQSNVPFGARSHASATYDAKNNRILVFGGSASNVYKNDLWSWNGTTWQQIETSGPGPRISSALVYSAVDKMVYLFGGYTKAGVLQEIWKLKDDEWSKVSTDMPPVLPGAQGVVVSPKNGTFVIFGGVQLKTPDSPPKPFNEMWTWDRATWKKIDCSNCPSFRFEHSMVNAENKVYLYGGVLGPNQVATDFWSWNGLIWEKK